MPQDVKLSEEAAPRTAPKDSQSNNQRRWFTTPEPIKRLFNQFPLRTYPPNELPLRKSPDRTQHNLYIFATDNVAKLGLPSFNPGCLKWQAYLKFQGISFSTVPSNNHASPTGALPFLLPASSMSALYENGSAIPSAKLQRWVAKATEQANHDRDEKRTVLAEGEAYGMRHEAYSSLLDRRIRNAWLYFLYLEPANFAAVAYPLYITPCSSNFLVRTTLAYNLRAAAKSELLKHSSIIDVESLYEECESAFSALSELLGDDQYFFDTPLPGLFDASVFAYTNTLLDGHLDWREWRMAEGLKNYSNLVRHRQRIYQDYFPESIS